MLILVSKYTFFFLLKRYMLNYRYYELVYKIIYQIVTLKANTDYRVTARIQFSVEGEAWQYKTITFQVYIDEATLCEINDDISDLNEVYEVV